MKSILCPTDFSGAARSGIEYAAQLARALQATITLTYVRPTIWPEAIQLTQDKALSNEKLSEQLQLVCKEIRDTYGVVCNFHLQTTTDTLAESIAAQASFHDMIVMGTNGAENYYQHMFGSNTFHVIEQSKCPVLLVPEGCTYKIPRVIVYAYDPETNPIFLIDQLKQLVKPLDTSVHVLHISEETPSEDSDMKIVVLKEAVRARVPSDNGWTFDSQYSDDISWALDHYMTNHDAEILAMSFHHRTLLEKVFTQSVVKKITMVAQYPVYVFWY